MQESSKLCEEMREAMDKAIQEKISLKVSADERKEAVESLQVENGQLKKEMQHLTDNKKQLATQIRTLQTEVDDIESKVKDSNQLKKDKDFL